MQDLVKVSGSHDTRQHSMDASGERQQHTARNSIRPHGT
jgi:hypothetical protein